MSQTVKKKEAAKLSNNKIQKKIVTNVETKVTKNGRRKRQKRK
jgi:hypothetical protein